MTFNHTTMEYEKERFSFRERLSDVLLKLSIYLTKDNEKKRFVNAYWKTKQ